MYLISIQVNVLLRDCHTFIFYTYRYALCKLYEYLIALASCKLYMNIRDRYRLHTLLKIFIIIIITWTDGQTECNSAF